MKAVSDTDIIVAGLYSKRGASYQLLKTALSGELSFAVSPLVAFEYEGVLHRKIEIGFLKISKRDCGKILDALFAMATIVWRPLQVRPVLSDPADDKIIECAITKEIAYKEAATALRDRIKRAPSRAESLKLLESIVPDVPPLREDKIISAKGQPVM